MYILVRLHLGFGSFVTLCDDVISAAVAGYGKQLDFGVYLALKHQLCFCGVWRGTLLMENRAKSLVSTRRSELYGLLSVHIRCSAVAFSCCQTGFIFQWRKSKCTANLENCSPLKGEPLSVFRTMGMPNMENILSRTGMTALALTDLNISTTG